MKEETQTLRSSLPDSLSYRYELLLCEVYEQNAVRNPSEQSKGTEEVFLCTIEHIFW